MSGLDRRLQIGEGRREFLRTAGTGIVGAVLGMTAFPAAAFGRGERRRRHGTSPRREPWGRLEELAEGVWALISTPLAEHPHARRTLCNGGIIAGREGVMVVEAFASPEGAAWLADEALRLTGIRPTHAVLTHYHGDHVSGASGYLRAGDPPRLMSTHTTRRLLAEQEAALPEDRAEARPLLMPDVVLSDDGAGVELNLGGRTVRLRPRRGHTPSDLVVEVDGVIFAGDLVWNGMFPNYVDAIPSQLSRHVRSLRDQRADVYVSGHGELTGPDELGRYIDLLDHVEAAARRAITAGRPLEEAAADYTVPASLDEWHMFSPRYPEVAFRAWGRELAA